MIRYFFLKPFIRYILILVLLSIGVFVIQLMVLSEALKIGFSPDDWILFFDYKTLGDSPFFKVAEVWKHRGAYTTYQVYYIGFLVDVIGLDYQKLQLNNIIFKTLATVSFFPLVLVIFKDRILAFFAIIFLSLTPSFAGSLEYIVKGSDYISVIFLNIFLLVYLFNFTKSGVNWKLELLGFMLLIASLIFSPIRSYPIFGLIFLSLIFYIYRSKSKQKSIMITLLRLLIFCLPFILLLLYNPNLVLGYSKSPFDIWGKITTGNWHLLLYPFSGLGYSFVINDYYGKFFGTLMVNDLKSYLTFILGGPTIIFSLINLSLCYFLIKPKFRILVFLSIFSSNLIIQLLVYYLYLHNLSINTSLRMNFDPSLIYSTIVGIFVFLLSSVYFFAWLKGYCKNNLAKGIWFGGFFSFIFVFLIWVFAPLGTGFSETSYYLVVASIGSSLWMATYIKVLLNGVYSFKFRFIRYLCFASILFIFPIFYLMSYHGTNTYFKQIVKNGRGAEGQLTMQLQARSALPDWPKEDKILVYFDMSEEHQNGRFYTESLLTSFPYFMHFQNGRISSGCIESFYQEKKELFSLIKTIDGKKGFYYRGLCVTEKEVGYKDLLYDFNEFYAFKIRKKELINVTKEILNEYSKLTGLSLQ